MTRATFLLAALAFGCKKESTPPPAPVEPPRAVSIDAPSADAAAPVAPADAAEPPPIDAGVSLRDPGPIQIAARTGAQPVALLVDDARTYVASFETDLVVQRLEVRYVRADGSMDPTYGELIVTFDAPTPTTVADDPARPIGAPVPEPVTVKPRRAGSRCPRLVWKPSGWASTLHFCTQGEQLVGPRCAVTEIWARAVAKGAPKDALAVLEIQGPDPRYNLTQRWQFRITDRPRKVDVRHLFADDCTPVVEK